jgi:hypothetical protein
VENMYFRHEPWNTTLTFMAHFYEMRVTPPVGRYCAFVRRAFLRSACWQFSNKRVSTHRTGWKPPELATVVDSEPAREW